MLLGGVSWLGKPRMLSACVRGFVVEPDFMVGGDPGLVLILRIVGCFLWSHMTCDLVKCRRR